jgi:hypothetical protein
VSGPDASIERAVIELEIPDILLPADLTPTKN